MGESIAYNNYYLIIQIRCYNKILGGNGTVMCTKNFKLFLVMVTGAGSNNIVCTMWNRANEYL